jgi:hypothetical protein
MAVTGLEVQIVFEVLVKCVKLYNVINTAVQEYRRANKDAENLTDFIRIEINRLREIHETLFAQNVFQVLTATTQDSVVTAIKNLSNKLSEYGRFISDTEISNSATATQTAVIVVSSPYDLSHAVDDALAGRPAELTVWEEPQFGRLKRLKWVLHDHKKLKGFKADIHEWVELFLHILPQRVLNSTGLDIDQLTALSLANEEFLPGLAPAAKLKTIAMHRINPLGFPLSRISSPLEAVVEIDRSQLSPLNPGFSRFSQTSEFMSYNGQQVLVEKKFWPKFGPHNQEKIKQTIADLGYILKVGSKSRQTTKLNVLECIGYFHEQHPSQSHSSLVFALPLRNGRSPELVSLVTLIDIQRGVINSDSARYRAIPGLDERFELAQALARSLSLLHAEGWLHKSIRGENIVFLDYGQEIDYSNPYLVGFEYSRRQDQESGRLVDGDWRNDLYRHPERQGQGGSVSTDFEKKHDYFALGAVLVEIGYWQTLVSLGKFGEYAASYGYRDGNSARAKGSSDVKQTSSGETTSRIWKPFTGSTEPNPIKEELVSLVGSDILRGKVGKVWKEVALKCLNGDFGVRQGAEGDDSKLQEAFLDQVVEKLHSLFA